MSPHHRSDSDDVVIQDTGIRATEVSDDVGARTARDRFGGIDVPATLTGALVALALLGIVGGLVAAAIGGIGYQLGATAEDGTELGIASIVGGLVTVAIAFLVGGWAAGRIARYDGGRNGIMVAVWVLLLGLLFAGLGAWLGAEYDVLDRAELPRLDQLGEETGIAAIATAIATLAVMFLAAGLGGKWGTRYHRRADAAIVNTRSGGVARVATHEHVTRRTAR